MKSIHRRRSGFMLLMVLVIIVLVSIVVAGFANHSLKVSVDSQAAEHNIQRRWANASCQRVAVELASEMLEFDSITNNPSNSKVQSTGALFDVELMGVAIRVIVSDESSKPDLNTLLDVVSQDQAIELARNLLTRSDVRLQFREMSPERIERSAAIRRLQSWDQVFTDLDGLPLPPEFVFEQTQALTLWGGKLNYRRSSETVLREVAKAIAGPIIADRLVETRKKSPEFSYEQAVKAINPTEQQAIRLGQLIGDQSEAISVWTKYSNGNRDHFSLLVSRTFGPTISRYYTFSW